MYILQQRKNEQGPKRAIQQVRSFAQRSWLALALACCQPPEPLTALKAEQWVREAVAEICECDCGTVIFMPTYEIEFADAVVMPNVTAIRYNPSFADGLCESCLVGMFGHEYGHHFSLGRLPDRKEAELAADKFSGCILRIRGMDPTDWMATLLTIGWEETDTHPSGPDRANAVRTGWEECDVVE